MLDEIKNCQNCKIDFTIEEEDFEFYKRIEVPPPTFCPKCRFQRRIVFRNERKLFRNKSAKSGETILSLYPPESGLQVYSEKEWWSDDWDPMKHGKDYNFSRPFFEQFHELIKSVPLPSRSTMNMVNSDYSGNAADLKNCYLVFNANDDEDCAYANATDHTKNSYDCSNTHMGEYVYEGFWIALCHKVFFSTECESCNDVWLSRGLRGCNDCFGCVNLRNKRYHIFNEPYSKEEYTKKLAEMKLKTWSGLQEARKKARDFWLKFPRKFMTGAKNVNCSGVYVTHSKNVRQSYLMYEGENLKYCQYIMVKGAKDCQDITVWGSPHELGYENIVCGSGSFNNQFCSEGWPELRDSQYVFTCNSSNNLFACVGLRKKEFCIFNKQYTKEEYKRLVPKIKKHMDEMPYTDKAGRVYKYGEMFPAEISWLPYNHTIAQEHFPITKEEAVKQGFPWAEIDKKEYEITLNSADLPDAIEDVEDSILKELIKCEECSRAYRIIPPELNFLRAMKIPLPRKCVDCRHSERISQRLKYNLYDRQCQCAGTADESGGYKNTANSHSPHGADEHCPNKFKTGYPPESKEIVYCEACYQAEVV